MGIAFILCTIILAYTSLIASATQIICPFQSIIQFGASRSDTGNLIRVLPVGPTLPAAHPPYGITFPGRPTGRWSDGRLSVDYASIALGLPLLNPYLDKNASFRNGVNFAVAGAPALDFSFFTARGIKVPPIVKPLSVQLSWFRDYLKSTCSTPTDCAAKLRRALVFVGQIGGNDINYALTQGKSVQEIQTYVPVIVEAIINATREVIKAGALRIVVPGNYPIGCFPYVKSARPSNNSADFDSLGCLIRINNLAMFQNNYLQNALGSLRTEFPNVVILYGDYYNAFLSVLRRAPFLGFDPRKLSDACCGVKGQYQPLGSGFCGSAGAPVCNNPNQFIYWDGIHLTQAAYQRISEIVITDILLRIRCIQ